MMAVRNSWSRFRRLVLALSVLLLVWRCLPAASRQLRLDYGQTSSSVVSRTLKTPRYQFAVVTFTTQELSYTHLSLKNKQHYARKHGYDLVVDFEAPQRPHSSGIWWHKFAMLERLIKTEEYEWLWWIDFDTLITNTSMPLTDITGDVLEDVARPEDIDFILSDDCNKLNTGSMLVRSTPTALAFLEQIYAYGASNHELSEQSAMRDLIVGHTLDVSTAGGLVKQHPAAVEANAAAVQKTKKTVVMVPQWWMNAFPEEIKCYDHNRVAWGEGMFVVHFAGAWAHMTDDDAYGVLMRRYEKFILW